MYTYRSISRSLLSRWNQTPDRARWRGAASLFSRTSVTGLSEQVSEESGLFFVRETRLPTSHLRPSLRHFNIQCTQCIKTDTAAM